MLLIGVIIFFLLVDDEVLALAFAEVMPAIIAADLPGYTRIRFSNQIFEHRSFY